MSRGLLGDQNEEDGMEIIIFEEKVEFDLMINFVDYIIIIVNMKKHPSISR